MTDTGMVQKEEKELMQHVKEYHRRTQHCASSTLRKSSGSAPATTSQKQRMRAQTTTITRSPRAQRTSRERSRAALASVIEVRVEL